METYSNGPQILQGQTVYQVIGKQSVMPQMQQAVQSNASLPIIVQSGYQYTPTSNMVASSGPNRSAEMPNMKVMNQANYVVQNVENSNKVVLWVQNPGYKNNNHNLNHVPGNKQRDQVQNIQSTGQGMSNATSANVATITTQKTFQSPSVVNHPAKELLKIPGPTHVNLNSRFIEKVGSLKIHISESFLPWNITNKTVLDLEFMRHLFNISGVDVILTDAKENEKAIRAAVEQLLRSRVLPDWLVLKCEEKEIPFLKVNNQVEIYTASNFTALLNVVTQETCLPLPYITEENNYLKYLYLNFPKTGNDRVKKLNLPIFHILDDGRRKLLCKYPGIRLDCEFDKQVENFVIHVHQSALLVFKTSLSKIRRYIIYKHIVWGFLQMWIRRLVEKYNQCFNFDDIAVNLSLCRFEDGKSCGNDNELIYDIGYLNCYFKFDPVTLKETKATFLLENFATSTVCHLAIVQFYKQFFLLNDMQFSDALKCSVLFFQDYYCKNVMRASSYVGVPPSLKSLRLIPRTNESPPEQMVPVLNNAYNNGVNSNASANTSGIAVSQAITIGSINKTVIQVGPDKTSAIPVLEKPRLKARTVEEINSSVDLVNRTNVNNSVVASDRLKTRTVEINSPADLVKRTEMNNRPVAPAVGQTSDAKRRDNARRLNYGSFVSLIQKFLENCYATNKVELSSRDESTEEVVIKRRFDEAVRRAIGMETIELFIEKIYVHLQLYYTNSTSQNILNKMIWRAIEAKYPHLKEHVSKNIAKSLRDKLADGDPRNSNNSSVLESNGRLNETAIGNNQNSNQNNIPTSVVTQQPDITNSNSEKVVCSSGENDQAVSAISKDRDVDLENDAIEQGRKASSPCELGHDATEQGRKASSPCELGNDATKQGRKASSPCELGSEATKQGRKASSPCELGNDATKQGRKASSDCELGSEATKQGRKASSDCELGSEATKQGRKVSSPCELGSEATKQGRKASSPCELGNDATKQRRKASSPCELGNDATKQRRKASSPCELGNDATKQGRKASSPCELGNDATKRGRKASSDCELGHDAIKQGRKVSSPCELGSEATKQGRKASSPCELGNDTTKQRRKASSHCELGNNATKRGRKAPSDCEIVNDTTKRGSKASSPCIDAEKMNEQEPPVPLASEEPKDRNACSSEILEERLLKKNKKQSKLKRSNEFEKECLPYRNTLTFVRVSTSPATFRISSRSEINSKTQSTELEENESCSTPEGNSIQASNETETDRASKELEQCTQTVEQTEEVNEECPLQEGYSKYNLKPCSVVLNSNEVKMYMKKYMKKKRREISESDVEQDEDYVPGRVRRRFYGDDSDDSDFITERKRIRRAVSEIQYMEARTRVLQRLRKRKSLYVGYERTRISGEELDNFLVRQGSFSQLNHQEDSGEESQGEYGIGEGNDSEPEESQNEETRTKKEPAMKEVRVVLVRLEDTPEYEEHRARLFRKEKWNPSVNYSNLKKYPHIKRKYFEIREGKLYLKEGYSVKDGEIVRTDKEVSPISPKREPESPARETDFHHHQIKRESALD